MNRLLVPMTRSGRILFACVIGSLTLHLAALALLPQGRRDVPTHPPRVLDVALVKIEPPQPLPAAAPEAMRAPAAAARQPAASVPKREDARRPRVLDQPNPALPEPHPVAEPQPPAAAPATELPETGAAPSSRSAAGAPREPPAGTPPLSNAEYLRNPPPPYPLNARRNGEQGTVTLRVLVTREGVPAQVSIEKSSGSNRLDGAALEAVRSWRFVPARRGAEAVEAWVLVPVVFRLEGAS